MTNERTTMSERKTGQMTDTDLTAVHNLLDRIFRDHGARRLELKSLVLALDVAQADVVTDRIKIDRLEGEVKELRKKLKAKGKA